MAKDPAFLFYSKDWLEGTADMTRDEKGIFIDLLSYQHQRGYLPDDTKRLALLCRMSETEFKPLWDVVGKKFQPNGTPNGTPNGIANVKLTEVMGDRAVSAKKSRIVGNFAALCRGYTGKRIDLKQVRADFVVSDWLEVPTELITERLTTWFTERLASLEDGNADAIEDKDSNGSNELVYPFETETFKQAWAGWNDYRKVELRKTWKSSKSEQIALNKLGRDAGNEETAIAMIEQSIANQYQGLFELKHKQNGKQSPTDRAEAIRKEYRKATGQPV